MRMFFVAVLAASVGLSAAAHAQPSLPVTPAAVAEQIADRYIKEGKIEAVSIGVTFEGEAFTVHKGPLYRDKPEPADDETIFELRSITKTFTGTLAAQAILDGKLSFNTDIRTYLDGDYPNLQREGRPILLRHLLTHTSGLPSNNPVPKAMQNEPSQSDAGGLRWRAFQDVELAMTKGKFFENLAGFELASTPGEAFNYSNLGTNLTALILEKAYDKSLDELVQHFILEPAGMDDTTLAMTDDDALKRLAGGYNAVGELVDPWPVWPIGGAEGAAKATVPDAVRYMQFNLSERNPATKLAHVPLHELAWDYRIASFWWVIDRPAGSTSFRHDGGYANVRNVMIIFPYEELGIYVVTNRVTPDANKILETMVYDIRKAIVDQA